MIHPAFPVHIVGYHWFLLETKQLLGHKDFEENEIALTTFKSLDVNYQKFVKILNGDRLKGKLSKSVNESLINGKDGLFCQSA